jgi:cysteine dioxygenase
MPLAKIETLDQLKKNLNLGPGYGGYIELLKAIDIPLSEWTQHIVWDEERYSRNCISSCEGYELLLMGWQEDQQSAIHSYNKQESWIKLLEGELLIETFTVDFDAQKLEVKDTILLKKGDTAYLNDDMGFHRMVNQTTERSISLHLHVESVREWEVLNPTDFSLSKEKPILHSKTEDCSNN